MVPFDLDDEELEATRKLHGVSWNKQNFINEEGYYQHLCPKCNQYFWYKAKHYYNLCPECKNKEEVENVTNHQSV